MIGGGFIACEAAASLALRGVAVTLIDRERAAPERARRRGGGEPPRGLARGARGARGSAARSRQRDRGRPPRAPRGRPRAREAPASCSRPACARAASSRRRAGLPTARGRGSRVDDGHARRRGATARVSPSATSPRRATRPPGGALRVEHWGDALGHGEVAGRVLAGEDAHWDAVPGFWSTIGERTRQVRGLGRRLRRGALRRRRRRRRFTVWYARDGVDRRRPHPRARRGLRARPRAVAAGAPPPS